MNGLRGLLKPGWVLGLLLVALFAWACFSVLAPWQLGKSDDLDARNARLTESVQAAPVPLAEATADPSAWTANEWHLVTTRGEWEPDREILLRLRSVGGDPVYQVLTVFRTDSGAEVLVNRGYVPVGEGNSVPPYPSAPPGPVDLTARLRAAETGATEPIELAGHTMVRSVVPAQLSATLARPLVADGYLQLTADQPGSLTPAPIPAIETGPYFSYGLQWIAFGVLAPLALGYFAWSELRQRGRARAAAPDDGAREPVGDSGSAATGSGALRAPDPVSGDDVPDDGPPPDAADLEERARARAMAERYGEHHDAGRRLARRRGDRLRDR